MRAPLGEAVIENAPLGGNRTVTEPKTKHLKSLLYVFLDATVDGQST